ncbi:hypothetical protein EDD85DRAFT_788854 [Armillaria nabsnona]|nr:hypothetical protein EDD85DRAFT_788854 [Armillaria nabsnona]
MGGNEVLVIQGAHGMYDRLDALFGEATTPMLLDPNGPIALLWTVLKHRAKGTSFAAGDATENHARRLIYRQSFSIAPRSDYSDVSTLLRNTLLSTTLQGSRHGPKRMLRCHLTGRNPGSSSWSFAYLDPGVKIFCVVATSVLCGADNPLLKRIGSFIWNGDVLMAYTETSPVTKRTTDMQFNIFQHLRAISTSIRYASRHFLSSHWCSVSFTADVPPVCRRQDKGIYVPRGRQDNTSAGSSKPGGGKPQKPSGNRGPTTTSAVLAQPGGRTA